MTIFSKIIAGQIPSYKVAESEMFYAFLDIFPMAEGHVLVVPKIETDKLFDLPDHYLAELLIFAKPIAYAIEQSFDCNRCGMVVIGLDVPQMTELAYELRNEGLDIRDNILSIDEMVEALCQ